MIDLNPDPSQPLRYSAGDLDRLSDGLAARASEIFPPLFPHAISDGEVLRMADISGRPPRKNGSCIVKLKGDDAGCHYDYATGKGGRPLSTYSKATGLKGRALIETVAEEVGAAPVKANGHARPRLTDADKTREIEFTLSRCEPAHGTLVETYLNSRRLDLPPCNDVLYHPDLTDYADKVGRPGMVVRLRRPDTGELVDSVHRTYLADDGSGKADIDKPKMLLGSPSGGIAMLLPMREDGVLGIGEGIETSLAAAKISGIPVWAGLYANGMRNFLFPAGLRELTIFADRGDAGEAAAWNLYDRAAAEGILAFVVLPQSDDDFAKDLERGDCSVDGYVPLMRQHEQPPLGAADPGASSWLQRPGVHLIHFRDMEPRIEDRTIVADLLQEGEMSAAVGASGTSKTFFVVDLGLHVAGGRTWFERPTRQTGVIYIAAEAGRSIQNRIVAYRKHYPDIPAGLPFAAIVSPVNLRDEYGANGLMEVLGAIRAADLAIPVGLIIVDTLSRAMAGGDENSSDDMGEFIANMDKLREQTGAHVLIVHHLGKDASRGARGHSSFHAAVDTEIMITRDTASGISTATVTKQRELPTSGRISYRLRSVELGRDQNDRPVTSCVVEPADGLEVVDGTAKSRLTAKQKRALDLLVDAVAGHGEVPPTNDHIPPKVPCVRESYWRACCYAGQISDSDNQDSKRKAFTRAAEDLAAAGRIGKWGEWVWPVA